MSSSSFQQAIILNNHGVRQLELGDFKRAQARFHEALELIKWSIPKSQVVFLSPMSIATSSFKWSRNVVRDDHFTPLISQCDSYMFRRALLVIVTSGPEVELSNTKLETAAIIYNLALSLLISGYVTNTSYHLRKSIMIFEIALAVQNQGSGTPSFALSNHMALFQTAISNNLGWIHRELCNFELADKYFQYVHCCLQFCAYQSTWESLDEKDCEGFLNNQMWGIYPSAAPAA